MNPIISQQDDPGVATNSILFVAETAKSLGVEPDQLRSEFAQKLMSRSAALASEYENCLVTSVKDTMNRFQNLSRKIHLQQRLSDSEKTRLLQFFSPPYKIIFSTNPTDIGSHLYYRALNEIATFRCYDLIGASEKTPPGYHVLIKEVGASISKLIKYERSNVHACTPNLSFDDCLRISNTSRTIDSYTHMNHGNSKQKELAKRFSHDPVYHCSNKSESCYVKAKYLVFAHSSYDCTLQNIANMMDAASAWRAYGFIHYSPRILSNLMGGNDNGLNWRVECRGLSIYSENYRPRLYIVFWFDDDYQSAYIHDLDTYLGIIKHSVCTSDKGNSYLIQRLEELGGLLFYCIIKPTCSIPNSIIIRNLPLSDPDRVVVHYYDLQNDPSKYHYHDLVPCRLVVPKKYFEKLYYYLQCLPEGKFTTQNAVTMASTMANRTMVNGMYVTQPYALDIETIDRIAYATYFIVYCRRYDFMEVLKKLKNFEDLKRNPTFFNRIMVLLGSVRSFIFSSGFEQYIDEKELEDVIKNCKVSLDNDFHTKHSFNVLQWLLKLFRIKNRYNVNFIPVTRVVTIEEDIEAVRVMTSTLPKMDPDNQTELEEFIKERMNITRVDSNKCSIDENHVCKTNLVEVPNTYEASCIMMCFSNRRNMPVSEVRRVLLSSETFKNLSASNRISLRESILGEKSEVRLFELLAVHFHVNICVHFELSCTSYNVSSAKDYHFMIKDNHCVELREKLPFAPFEFAEAPIARPREGFSDILAASRESKDTKFKMNRVRVETFSPFVCRSALKLLELDYSYGVIIPGKICELSGAPGGWLQYCHMSSPMSTIYYSHYIDGLEMQYDHSNFTCLNECYDGDLTSDDSVFEIGSNIERLGMMDVLLSDACMMKTDEDCIDVDKFRLYQHNFFSNVVNWVKRGGNVVFKSFCDIDIDEATNIVLNHFDSVIICKPNFSAPLSTEYYIVCKGFDPEKVVVQPPAHNYCYTPRTVFSKTVMSAKTMLKKRFPPHITYTVPSFELFASDVEPVNTEPTAPVVEEELIENVIDDVSCVTFETKLIKAVGKLKFYDIVEPPTSKHFIELPDVNPDVHIAVFDSDLLVCESTEYAIYPSDILRVDLSAVKSRDVMAKLKFIAVHIATFRLRVLVDFTGVRSNGIIRSLVAYCKEEFKLHELILVSPPTDQTYSVDMYEKSIVEYCSYVNVVRACNSNNYMTLYAIFKANKYKATHSFIANTVVDTQNISIVHAGGTYLYKHVNVRESYTHAYCGETSSFVEWSQVVNNPQNYYLVGEYTYRLFDHLIAKKVSEVNIDALRDVQFVLCQGIAGHGKTREIVSKHTPGIKSRPEIDLVVAPSRAGREVLWERTLSHYKLDRNVLDPQRYRTVSSYLINTDSPRKFLNLYVDEAIMMHVAQVLAVAYYSGARTVYMYGDTAQIPAHSKVGGFALLYHAPQILFKASEIRNKSYRIPADVAASLDSTYREVHAKYGPEVGIKTASTVVRSMNVVKIHSVDQMKEYYNPDVKYLVFTHTALSELSRRGDFNPSTIAAYQGSEHPEVAIVRLSISAEDPMYNDANICVTAMTRHTKKLTYYTCCEKDDLLAKKIKYAADCTDLHIKRFSTSEFVGSFNPDLIPQYGVSSATRFFKSRQNLTASFTVVDHRNFCTEKEFAVGLIGIKNDVFVDKSVFRRFDMSVMIKWIKKLAPNVKEIFVRTRGESFQNNSQIVDLVEDYKCANVIATTVSEKLVATVEPYFPPEIKLHNYIRVAPTVEMLQTFMSHLYPNAVYVTNQFDAYFVHTNDISYTLQDVSFSPLWDRYTPSKYACLRPVLSTPAPAVREVSQREVMLGIMKRNLNPPKLVENVCAEDVSDHLLQNFNKMMIRDWDLVCQDMEPIVPTTDTIISWLERQDRSILKNIINDIPIQLQSLSSCSLSLKRHPKVRVSPDVVNIYDSVQTITCHEKFVNGVFCTTVDMAQDRIMKLMKPYFLFNTKCTTEDFSLKCYRVWKKYGKLYLFSGDDSLLMSGRKCKEMDMSKFDKSQLNFALLFLCKLFTRIGVADWIVALYYEMMYYRVCTDKYNKVTMILTPQMESGCAATYFGNTCFCAAVVLSCMDLDDFSYTPRLEKFSLTFNLEVKEFNYDNPYFCSKFMVFDEDHIKFYPDPVKILIKLGRSDIRNYTHLKEFHVSLKDLVSQYDSLLDISVISAAVRERYGFPYDCTFLIQNLISLVLDDNAFSKLFYTLPGDVLDVSAKKFVDD
ncbi:putative replicase protein [Uxmal virus]|uniref:Replicase protein n=1 Tax=Uxmal virus TaxID=2488578 RepID=A0A3G5BMK6_9VIRU|nr:putative replicase protein [Uxmal virus]